jgi:murein DD-endopeptidase MepM/ murein hydrolase activator NlpD
VETEPGAKCRPPAHPICSHTTLAAPPGDCYLRLVASSGAGGPHHAGLVVDPLARDDDPDPGLTLEGGEAAHEPPPPSSEAPVNSGETRTDAGAEGPPSGDLPGMHPVRARLLAKAASVRPGRVGLSGLAELEPSQAPPDRSLDLELDLVALPRSRAPSAPVVRQKRGHLSPNMIWLVGTLVGLVAVTTIVALAIRFDPHPGTFAPASASRAAPPASVSSPPPTPRARVKLPGPWRIADAEHDPSSRIVNGTVGRQAFLRALEDAGISKRESYRVLTSLKTLLDLDKCDRRDRFSVLIQRADARVKAFEYIVNKEEVYQAREGTDGLLRGSKLDLKVVREQVKGAWVMEGELGRSAERAGFDPSVSRVMAQALNGHMSVSEIERGDMLRMIAQEVTVLGEFARYAGMEALEYRPADEKKRGLRLYYFRGPKSRGHFDVAGRSPYEGGWRKPIPGAPITSHFNLKRFHPVLKKIMPHLGMDFGAPAGTPVGASSYGTVSFIGYAGPAGNLVRIQHPDQVETGYAHLQRFAEGLNVGDQVKRLEVIGYVGSTGRSTGPHLHFMAKKDNKYFDPMDLKLDSMRVLPEEERAAFAEAKTRYDRLLEAIPWPAPLPAQPEPSASASSPASEADGELIGMEVPVGTSAGTPAPSVVQPPTGTLTPPAASGSARAGGRAVYLTDQELLQSQPLSDDGESEE